MDIIWNEDKTKATIAAGDLTKLQGNFDKGYGTGRTAGEKSERERIVSLLSPLGLKGDDLESGITALAQEISDLKTKSIPPDKIKESDVVKNLQRELDETKTALEQKTTAFTKLENSSQRFKRETLFDSRVTALASRPETKAINSGQVLSLFKAEYDFEIVDGDKVQLMRDGNVLFDGTKGEPLTLEDAFTQYSEGNKYLFEAPGSGGPGKKPGDPNSASKVSEMSDEEFNQTVANVKRGQSVNLE